MALMHVDFSSSALGMCVQMDVISPQKPTGMIGVKDAVRDGKYPTLYLLHGMSDDHTIWQRRTSIERYVSDKGIAVVMPSTQLGWYTDMHEGMKWYSYIAEELPRICRSFFPNMSDKREDTFVCGLSMGGYGAFKLALRASETFGWGASLSGALDVKTLVEWGELGNSGYWYDVFGPVEKIEGSFNDLFKAASDLKESGKPVPKLYMWCGEQDFLFAHNEKMDKHLTELGIDHIYQKSPGDHQWKYWDEKVQTVLEWVLGKEVK